jgi:ribose transport system substrate-binding protein
LAVQQMTDLMTANPGLSATLPASGWLLSKHGAFGTFIKAHKQSFDRGAFSVASAVAAPVELRPVELRKVQDGEAGGLVGQRPYRMGQKATDVLLAPKEGEKPQVAAHAGLGQATKANASTSIEP